MKNGLPTRRHAISGTHKAKQAHKGASRKSFQRVGAKKSNIMKKIVAINFLLNGWGQVTGEDGQKHFVFIPLWDPAPMTAVGKAILATYVIKAHIAAVASKEAKAMLNEVVKEQAAVVAGGFQKAMDIEGDWCGTKVPGRIPGVGPIPHGGFDIFTEALGEKVSAAMNAKAALSLLGKMLGNQKISRAVDLI